MSKKTFPGFPALAPVPAVMVSCGDMAAPNIITIAWTGIINSDPPCTYISVRKSRFSHDIIAKKREFVINVPLDGLVRETDYCGCVSGQKVDKFAQAGLTGLPAEKVAAPLIAECPINMECKVFDVKELPSHDMFMAEIVAVHVDNALLDEKGKIVMEKQPWLAYVHGIYLPVRPKILGRYGYAVMKPKTKKRLAQARKAASGAKTGRHDK